MEKSRTLKTMVYFVGIICLSTTILWADFRFVSLADSRGSNNGVNTEILSAIATRIVEESPELVIFAGDLVSGTTNEEIIRQQYVQWLATMEPVYKAKIPVYVVPGNHEISGPNHEDIFREMFDMPMNGPEDCKELCYSFDYDTAHFVALDTDRYKNYHKIDLDWLTKDLEATDKKHIFVFGHDPAYPAGPHVKSSLDAASKERNRFWKLLVNHKVKAYFCGHEHLYQRLNIDGVWQIINGSCGAPIYRNYDCGEFYHYVVVDVKKNEILFTVKDETGEVKDKFSILLQKTEDIKK